jgi:hypothetical protein
MKKHPAIWFTLWAFETWFFINIFFASASMTELQGNLSELFIRVWVYVCLWFIFYFHVQWIVKYDEKQYKKEKEKEKKETLDNI